MIIKNNLNLISKRLAVIGISITTIGILLFIALTDKKIAAISFAVVGVILMLAAYVTFCINTIKLRGRKSIKLLTIPLVLFVLISSCIYASNEYRELNKNKIYSSNEVLDFKDFVITFNNISFENIDLNIDKNFTNKYKIAENSEDCSSKSREVTGSFIYANSEYDTCTDRVESVNTINNYINNNRKMSFNYNITAKKNTNTEDIKLKIILDSGRNPNPSDQDLAYLNVAARWYDEKSSKDSNYDSKAIFDIHDVYDNPNLNGYINTGASRTNHVFSDIRNSEKMIDIFISYKNEHKIMRILNSL